MAEYNDSDFPWTFYFNGVALPKWSQCWAACGLYTLAAAAVDAMDVSISSRHLSLLEFRIDHVGVVESEDPARFRVLALHLIAVQLSQRDSILVSVKPLAEQYSTDAETIYDAVRDGLFQMNELAARDGLAFWTTGWEEDRVAVSEAMRRHRLPVDHPDHLEAPHVGRERGEATLWIELLRKRLVHLLHTSSLPKSVRERIHHLTAGT